MTVYPVPAFVDNYIWAITTPQSPYFDCVDPGDAEPVLQFAKARQLSLRHILLTHHHNDHIGGVATLLQCYPACEVYGPADPRIPFITKTVRPNEPIHVGECKFEIIFNPGHTATHISYYEAVRGWLFCGDTLFSGGCGRVFDGTIEELFESLQLFKALPLTTKVFAAHEYTLQNLKFAQIVEPDNKKISERIQNIKRQNIICTLPSLLKDELLINPFLRTDCKEVIHYALAHGATSNAPFEVFKLLRDNKNRFK